MWTSSPRHALLGALLAFAPAAAASAAVRPAPPEAVPGELVVRFTAAADAAERGAARRQAGVELVRGLRLSRTQLVAVAPGHTVRGAITALERRRDVASAEPNWIFRAAATPNDPLFGSLWGLHNTGSSGADINAPEAWDISTGSADVVVAVTDTGVAYDHPDLAGNIWANPGEVAGNNVDDDANGYVDDVRGWDAADGDNDPRDLSDHGTHVAGTIAAVGDNGIGVAGVAWDASIMPVRVLDADGSGSYASVVEGFDYAGANGARIVNASLGGGAGSGQVSAMKAVVDAYPETLFVVAAGNEARNNETTASYPCNITSANLVCVAATTPSDGLASFSNYGTTSVDVGAPGTGVWSTMPDMTTAAAVDSFEAGLTNWTQGGATGSFVDTDSPVLPYSGSTTARDGTKLLDDQPATAGYASNEDYWIQSVAKVGLAGAVECVLTYAIRYDFDGGRDRVLVESSADGSSWTTRDGFTGWSDGWTHAETNLGATDRLHVRFRVVGDDTLGKYRSYDGVQLDDVRIRCVRTTYSGTIYDDLSGTSMATPHVAGGATVLLAAHPAASTADLRSWLLTSGDPVAALSTTTVTGRRLDLHQALLAAAGNEALAPVVETGSASDITSTTATLTGTVDPNGSETAYRFEWGPTAAYGSYAPASVLNAGAGDAPVGVVQSLTALAPSTTYHYRLVAYRGGAAAGTPGSARTFTTAAAPSAPTTTTDATDAPAPDPSPIVEEPQEDQTPVRLADPVVMLFARQPVNGVRLRVDCAVGCTVRTKLRAVKSLAKILRGRRVIASRSRTVAEGQTLVKVRLRGTALRRLRAADVRRAKGVLTVNVTDAAGQVTRSRRFVRVRIR